MALEVPNLPTESLHKFLSISGLLIVFGGVFYFATMLNDIQSEDISINTELGVLEAKSKALSNTISIDSSYISFLKMSNDKFYEADISRFQNLVKKGNKAELPTLLPQFEDRMTKYFAVQEKIVSRSLAQSEKLSALSIATAQIRGKENMLLFHLKQLKWLSTVCSLAITLGLLITYFGFKNWRIVQGYIDEAIKREVRPSS
jgi:hypothetical protein